MELISKNDYQIVAKEQIEYVDKKTGELKYLYKLYANDSITGIQEQLLVNKDTYLKIEKGQKGKMQYEKSQNGCYLKGFNLSK